MVFLTPSEGYVTIERTFRNVSSIDEHWGYSILIRMGRLDSQASTFSIKIKATAGSEEEIVLPGGATLRLPKFLEIEALAEELLPEPDTAYILRMGDIKLFCETEICVKLEISGEI